MADFRRFSRVIPFAVALAFIALSSATAQGLPPRPVPNEEGVLHLSETAQRDVPRDLLRATLTPKQPIPMPARFRAISISA